MFLWWNRRGVYFVCIWCWCQYFRVFRVDLILKKIPNKMWKLWNGLSDIRIKLVRRKTITKFFLCGYVCSCLVSFTLLLLLVFSSSSLYFLFVGLFIAMRFFFRLYFLLTWVHSHKISNTFAYFSIRISRFFFLFFFVHSFSQFSID